MPFSDKQQAYFREATHRWNVKTGATRSGKTFMDYFVIPKRLEHVTGKGLIVLLGNTQSTLERNILAPMRHLWGPVLVGTINKATGQVQLFGKKAYCLGADKVTQASKIQGAGIEYCYGDEITTWSPDVFTMLKSRLDKPNSCFDGTCNPDNPLHWFKKFLDSDADVYQQHYCIDDNPFLSPEFVDNLKREYSGTVYYDRYIKGLWTAAEGIIYRSFADNPDRYITYTAPQISHAVIGVDFGGNGSAHAFSCVGFLRGFSGLVLLDEYYRKEIITPDQLQTDFVSFVRRVRGKYIVTECFCDSAEQVLIAGLRQAVATAKIPINIYNARKSPINDRIRAMCMLQAANRFQIMSHCSHTIEALRSAVWDPKALAKDVRLDDGNYNIDSLDAMEYAYEHDVSNLIEARV